MVRFVFPIVLVATLALALGCSSTRPDPWVPDTTSPSPSPTATPETSDTAELAAEPIVDEEIEIDPDFPDYRSDEGM